MTPIIPGLLIFPLLMVQLITMVGLFKFCRHPFWWLMLGGILFTLAAFYLQARRFSYRPGPGISFLIIDPYQVLRIDSNSALCALAGLLLSTIGFALLAVLLYQLQNRIRELDLIVLAGSDELGRRETGDIKRIFNFP